jgi:putative hemolysin
MSQIAALKVNVKDILQTRAPETYVPRFLVKYLEHIVHQKEINQFLEKSGHLYGIDFLEASLDFLNIKIETFGLEHLPADRYTFVCNHPLGGIDGVSLGMVIHKRFPDQSIKYLSNDLLSTISNLLPLFVPVNKIGNQSQHRSLPERLTEAYDSNQQMVLFPSGICSRQLNGKITELKWGKSFIKKTIESRRAVVPVYFEGQNSRFFYWLANTRKSLRVKTNIEMLYLVNEMFKQRGKSFRVVFGEPIPYTTFDQSQTLQQWADWAQSKALELEKRLPEQHEKNY